MTVVQHRGKGLQRNVTVTCQALQLKTLKWPAPLEELTDFLRPGEACHLSVDLTGWRPAWEINKVHFWVCEGFPEVTGLWDSRLTGETCLALGNM